MKNSSIKFIALLCVAHITVVEGSDVITDNLTVYKDAEIYGTLQIKKGSIPTNHLVLHYSFDVDETNIVTDLSDSAYTGTVSGATWTNECKSGGGAYYFNNGGHIIVDDVLDITSVRSNLTVSLWMRTSGGASYQRVLSKQQTPSPYTGYSIMYYNNARADFIAASYPTQRANPAGDTNINDDQWHHVCVVYKRSDSYMETTIYVDGLEDGTDSYSGTVGSSDTSQELVIGARTSSGMSSYTGYVDEVYIYESALTDEEVASLYSAYNAVSGALEANSINSEFGFEQTSITGTNILQGRVGIGTNTPAEKLHVAGNAQVDGTLKVDGNIKLNGHWLSGDGDNEGVTVNSAGDVGIGTASPTATLHVAGSAVITGRTTIVYLNPLGDIEMGSFTNMP